MEFDLEIIERLFSEIERKRQILEHYRRMSEDEFNDDPGRIMAVEHGFQTMIQSMIDIGLHILTRLGRNGIESYTEVFDVLEEEIIIDPAFASRIKGMAGFRNILVHEYTKVDETIVKGFLQERLGDFREFERQVREYLERD